MAQKRTSEHGPLVLEGPNRGVDTKSAATKLSAGALSMLRNAEFVVDAGSFSIRRGTKQLTTSSLGSQPVRGGIRWYYGATPTAETLFVWSTSLYRLIGGATSPTDLGTLNGSSVDRTLLPFVGPGGLECVLIGSLSTIRRYEPAAPAIRAAGFPAPTSAPTAATGAAGNLNGSYLYKVGFGYDGAPHHDTHESSVYSVPSVQVNPANQQVNLSSVPLGGTGVTRRYLYRTKAIPSGVNQPLYYRVGIINDNTTTVFNDNVADASLSPIQAPTDNGQPPLAAFWAMMKGRIYALDVIDSGVRRRGRLKFSAISSTERNPNGTISVHGAGPEIWPSNYYVDIGDINGQGAGLSVVGDTLQIFMGNEIYLLRDNGATDLNIWKIEGNVGCIAPRSIVDMGGLGTFFLGRGTTTPTVYRLIGQRAYPVSDGIEPTLQANLIGLLSSDAIKPAAVRYRGQYLLSYIRQRSPSVEYEIAKYDPAGGRWEFDRGPRPACWIPALGSEDAGELWFGHADHGWIVRYDVDGGDFNHSAPSTPAAAQLYLETDWLDFGHVHQRKQIRAVYVEAEVQAGATLTLERRRDFNASGSSADSSAIPMTASVSGNQIFAFRVEGQMEGASSPDLGFVHKLCLTVDVPYSTVGEAFKPVRIHGITVVYDEIPPQQHVQA